MFDKRLITLTLALVLVVSCAVVPTQRAAGLRVTCNVPDAAVWIDDVPVGRVTDWAGPNRAITAGFHRVEIRHPNHYSHYAEIDLSDGKGTVITAKLHPLLE